MSDRAPTTHSPNSPSGTNFSEASLIPTTTAIIENCPRTRILIVGRSGVGKSSLVNAIFKTSFALVQDDKAGDANINEEHISKHNDRFVLHDSQGYEPGDKKKFAVLEKFIKKRTSPSISLSKRLHAIWLCIPVSFAGGRIFETGDEKIFTLEHGNVPIIVVFTQFDLLSATVMRPDCDEAPLDDAGLKQLVEKAFHEQCVEPFKVLIRGIGKELPFVPVSVHQPETLQNLVDVTIQNIPVQRTFQNTSDATKKKKDKSFLSRLSFRKKEDKPTPSISPSTSTLSLATDTSDTLDTEPMEDISEPAVVMATAQRIDPDAKIAASIKVGKKKYWRAIASGANFFSLRLSSCLKVIHIDIVTIWNIRGLNEYLLDDAFRGRMTKIVEDLSDKKEDNPAQGVLGSAGVAAKVAGAVGPAIAAGHIAAPAIVAASAATVAAPVVALVLFAAWAYAVYSKSPAIIRCMMAYVVDLIVINRTIFEASLEDKDGIVKVERVREIIDKFDKSTEKEDIHNSIRIFVEDQNLLFAKSAVVEKIESLIKMDRRFRSSHIRS